MYFPGTFRLILAWRGLHERVKEGNVAGAAETFGKLHVRIKGMFAKPPSKEGILVFTCPGIRLRQSCETGDAGFFQNGRHGSFREKELSSRRAPRRSLLPLSPKRTGFA